MQQLIAPTNTTSAAIKLSAQTTCLLRMSVFNINLWKRTSSCIKRLPWERQNPIKVQRFKRTWVGWPMLLGFQYWKFPFLKVKSAEIAIIYVDIGCTKLCVKLLGRISCLTWCCLGGVVLTVSACMFRNSNNKLQHNAKVYHLNQFQNHTKNKQLFKTFTSFTTNFGYSLSPPTTICATWRGVGQGKQHFIGRTISLPPQLPRGYGHNCCFWSGET